MIFDRNMFGQMLRQMDVHDMDEMSLHSYINHHVEGMNYICLSRDDRLTVKLYLIEDPQNTNSGFLVNPHSHRYAFSSRMLHGRLKHLRFKTGSGNGWDEFGYDPDHKTLTGYGQVDLGFKTELQERDSAYYVDENEVHTLQMFPGEGPVLIGLMQLADVKRNSELYLPSVEDYEMKTVKPRNPTGQEMIDLCARCLELIDA